MNTHIQCPQDMLPQHNENPFPKSNIIKNFSCMFMMSMEKKQSGTQQTAPLKLHP